MSRHRYAMSPCQAAHSVWAFGGAGVDYTSMDLDELGRSLQLLWENKPGIIVLLFLGVVVFIVLVVDAWRQRHRRRKRPR